MARGIVVKIGGHELDDEAALSEFAAAVRTMDAPVVIVHGGGREISTLQKALGIEPRYVDGVRVTDAQSLALVEMVLCGTVNKRLVRFLLDAGVEAVGLSGVDRGLIHAEKMQRPGHDMGYTGKIVAVRAELLWELLDDGVTPVVAPICLGPDSTLNVNADHVAAAIATAMCAEQMVFLSNVQGVLVNGKVVKSLTPSQAGDLITEGAIFGGMIPKVEMALGVLEQGVGQAVITNLAGLKHGDGTIFQHQMTNTKD